MKPRLVMAILLMASIVGCKPADTRPAIGVSLLTLQNPFFQVIADNIKAEAAKHGYQVIILSADEDVAKQGRQVEDFIVKDVAAIVLSPCQADAIGPVIREANAANIPVFTVDIPCRLDDVEIACQIATDNFGGGKEAAVGMIEALGETGGDVAILHFKQAESCQLRVQGFQEVIEEHNKQSEAPVNIVAVLEGGGAKDRGKKATEDLLQSNPDVAGIFAINDPSALGARAALEQAGVEDRVVIIGFDGQPDGKQAIKEGKIYADPIQFPDKMGVQVVESIVKLSKGEELENEILIDTYLYRQADALADPELQ